MEVRDGSILTHLRILELNFPSYLYLGSLPYVFHISVIQCLGLNFISDTGICVGLIPG